MNARQLLSVVLVMLGTIAAILPSKSDKYHQFSKEELDLEASKEMYYVSVDELAHLIISGDPSIQLIDIREKADTMLTRAINIPVDSIMSPTYEGLLYQRVKKTVLYSDDTESVLPVWKQLKYAGYPNVYILRGGMQAWKKDMLDPEFPGLSAPQVAIDQYNQRMAARLYFTGAKALPKTEFKVIIPAGGGRKKKVQGGCS